MLIYANVRATESEVSHTDIHNYANYNNYNNYLFFSHRHYLHENQSASFHAETQCKCMKQLMQLFVVR